MATQRKKARQQRAYDRFKVGERAQQDAAYMKRKAVEQLSLERSLGIKSTDALLRAATA